MKKLIACAVVLAVICGWAWNRASAHTGGTPGSLALNLPGINWVNPGQIDNYVAGVVSSSTKWVFSTVIWNSMEPDAPTEGDCTDPDGSDGAIYWNNGPSGKCHVYYVGSADGVIAGLQNEQRDIALGMMGHPTWAGGQSCNGPFGSDACAMVYRDHFPIFSEGAVDFARFLVERYSPSAFSVWNEPNGAGFLSLQPPPGTPANGTYSPELDYGALLLAPIADDLHSFSPGILIIGPEISTKDNGDNPSSAHDGNWNVNTGTYLNWTDFILDAYASKIDRWSLHAYGHDYTKSPKNQVANTWNKMIARGIPNFIWVTEMGTDHNDSCVPFLGGRTQRTMANYMCQVRKHGTWDRSFWFSASDPAASCANPLNPDAGAWRGLLQDEAHNYAPKWLRDAFHAVIDNNYYCS